MTDRPHVVEKTDRLALEGQLGRCNSSVRDIFAELDRLLRNDGGHRLEIFELSRGGRWLGRSYKLRRRNVLEVHPKQEWIKVKVDERTAPPIPKPLRPIGERRTGWVLANANNRSEAIPYLRDCLRAALAF